MKVYKEYIEKSFDNTEDLFEYLNSDEESQELIRCKDCKHYLGLAKCNVIGECGGTNFYCGWAERKE